jgi:hypothetical protein
MLTKWKLIRVDGTIEEFQRSFNNIPKYNTLREIVEPLTGEPMEHVSVWANYDFKTECQQLDMFVNENGSLNRLSRNETATTIYRRATMEGKTTGPIPKNPEELNFIVGPAVLFSRRVWF